MSLGFGQSPNSPIVGSFLALMDVVKSGAR